MRDPRRPPRVQSTSWVLRLRSEDEDGSPVHAWCFFVGFILFPIWWVASFWRIPETRRVGGTDTEKAVTLDDPQVEHGECTVCLVVCRTYTQFSRRKVVAIPMPHYLRNLTLHIHPLHRPGCNIRASVTPIALHNNPQDYNNIPFFSLITLLPPSRPLVVISSPSITPVIRYNSPVACIVSLSIIVPTGH